MAKSEPCTYCHRPTVSRSSITLKPTCADCKKRGAKAEAPIKPLPADKPLAPYRVPELRRSEFAHIPGQGAMDFTSDDPAAVVWED